MKKEEHGFIALFFILGISFTFLTWIALSSERVFQYIDIKGEFVRNRSVLHENMLCADAFVDIFIASRYNLNFVDNSYTFVRNLYLVDNFICKPKGIGMHFENESLTSIFFILDEYAFEYGFKNGFVNSTKSFHLP